MCVRVVVCVFVCLCLMCDVYETGDLTNKRYMDAVFSEAHVNVHSKEVHGHTKALTQDT